MVAEAIDTKFGTATLDKNGYYYLTTVQGEYSRSLHRRIWEDFYNKPVPKSCVIHHMNGNKTDNRIQNLQCCTRVNHIKFHAKGRKFKHTEEWKRKASMYRKGKNNPNYGKKKTREEMTGIITYKINSSKLSKFDEYWGLVYLMHRKHAGLTQREIIAEMGMHSSSYIIGKLTRLNLCWGDL